MYVVPLVLAELVLADWKVGSFEFAHSLDSEKDFVALQETYAQQQPQAIPPEYAINENNASYLSFNLTL